MDTVMVKDPILILLAPGEGSEQANRRGHLFEHFMANVMHQLGYEAPTTDKLNVTREGVELDISLSHALDGSSAIAECKAYTSNIGIPLLTAFYGRLAAERLGSKKLKGFLFATPRLTAEATELAKSISHTDTDFKVLTAANIWTLLEVRRIIDPIAFDPVSDHALVIHESGTYCAALQIDSSTRTASQVVIKAKTGGVASEVLELLREHPYSQGLPVVQVAHDTAPAASAPTPVSPVVIEVRGSHSDFEYQLPASPKYFVGRTDPIRELKAHVAARGGPFVLNAQSGWGKSSLALKIASINTGTSLVLDTRTASSPTYVAAALKRAAEAAVRDGLLILPEDATWATTGGALRALETGTWIDDASVVAIFDQFENVFANEALTSEFRDAAVWNSENHGHVTFGFAWKTDYVDWIENHPYRLRDQIRDSSKLVQLLPFGSREVDTILRRLEAEVNLSLSRELRQRLREYSQGYPWLLKKLSGHVIRELKSGKTQEQLIGEALNVQDLFDSDLSALSPQEREALSFIARYAPVQASEATELHTAGLVQSLLNQRLIVQVGEKLDTYWDIFRDYLNTGRVPIEDSYILRLSPNSVARLVSELLAVGGTAASTKIAETWDTSESVVWNSVRELRQLGLASYVGGQISLIPAITSAPAPEQELRLRVATALRRHRAWTEFSDLNERGQGRVTVAGLSGRLRDAFPAVEGTAGTWTSYARSFAAWLEYAGLIVSTAGGYSVAPEGSLGVGFLTSRSPSVAIGVFPTKAPGPAIELLKTAKDGVLDVPKDKRKYLSQLVTLGAVSVMPGEGLQTRLVPGLIGNDGAVQKDVLLRLLEAVPGGRQAVEALRSEPGIGTQAMGEIFASAYGTPWTASTQDLVGKNFFGWARAAGLKTARRSRAGSAPA